MYTKIYKNLIIFSVRNNPKLIKLNIFLCMINNKIIIGKNKNRCGLILALNNIKSNVKRLIINY